MSELIGTTKYGNYYFCVKTGLSADGEIYVVADSVEVAPSGNLIFWRDRSEGKALNLSIAAGEWSAVFAASLIDGAAIAVAHWRASPAKESRVTGQRKIDSATLEHKIIDVLKRRGPMNIRELTQYIKGLSSVDAREIAQQLVESGQIKAVAQGKTTRYGV